MHYYKRNIGDYQKKAGRLSILEHGAYTLLIDACYDRERFPSKDEAIDWCWARSPDECAAVEFVLSKFFELVDGKYVQSRIQEEIDRYHANADTNSRIAKEREAKRRARIEHEPCANEHEPPPNQEPLTKNQEPEIQENGDYPISPIDPPISDGRCGLDEVVDLYHEMLPNLPAVRMRDKKRRTALAARQKDYPKAREIEWWQAFFGAAGESKFLMGETSTWNADFDFLTSPKGFKGVIEGKYK